MSPERSKGLSEGESPFTPCSFAYAPNFDRGRGLRVSRRDCEEKSPEAIRRPSLWQEIASPRPYADQPSKTDRPLGVEPRGARQQRPVFGVASRQGGGCTGRASLRSFDIVPPGAAPRLSGAWHSGGGGLSLISQNISVDCAATLR
jgi:hypothetical protein